MVRASAQGSDIVCTTLLSARSQPLSCGIQRFASEQTDALAAPALSRRSQHANWSESWHRALMSLIDRFFRGAHGLPAAGLGA